MSTATAASFQPRGEALVAFGPGWKQEMAVATVARCQLYNGMEARVEWHAVIPAWDKVAESATGWRLPCRVDIPFVGTVITFDVVATHRPELQAVELSIPAASLRELDVSFAKLMRLDLLPGFAAAAQGEDGYLLLPCLAGSLHRFNHQVSREERVVIYARQDQWAMRSNYNCIGMQRPGLAWCAIVTAGEFDAEAVIRSHYEEEVTYSVHTGLVYRWEPDDALLTGDRTVRFHLLDPATHGWAAFARIYRQFLRAERGVRTWKEKAAVYPKALEFAHGFTLKIFQGCKKRDFAGRGEYQSATSFAEARQILETMQAEGIANITAQLVGWNLEGHDGRYPTRFPVNPVEGGEEAMRALIAWGKEHNVIVTVHDNFQDSYEVGADFTHADGLVLRNGQTWRNVPWCGGFNWRMCPLASIRHAERDLPKMKAMGIDGNYYLDALAAFNTCHSPEHPANRAEYIAGFRKILTMTRKLFGTLSLEVPFGPYFDLLDGVYIDDGAPWLDNFTPFRRQFVDEVVPFLPIALHNSVRYQRSAAGSGRVAALRALAWGAMPFIEVSARSAKEAHAMPTYEQSAEFARAGWQLCCAEYGDLVEQDLENVETLGPDLFRTTFGNGTVLLVNASNEPAKADGQTVPALGVVRR